MRLADAADLSRKAVRELLVVAAEDDVHFGVAFEPPRRVADGDRLTFAMAGRHEDHQAFAGAVGDLFEVRVEVLEVREVPAEVWGDAAEPGFEMRNAE